MRGESFSDFNLFSLEADSPSNWLWIIEIQQSTKYDWIFLETRFVIYGEIWQRILMK